jgi:hypothetical protein
MMVVQKESEEPLTMKGEEMWVEVKILGTIRADLYK